MIRYDARPRALAGTAGIAGIALVATVIAPAPVVAPPPTGTDVQLTAGDDTLNPLNIPANLLIDLVNVPYNAVHALQQVDEALEFSGSWFVPSVTNVWGWDDGDWYRGLAMINLLVPFPALSDPLGLNIVANNAAETPTNVNCASVLCILDFGPDGIWAGFNKVPLQELADGYTFPTVPNPMWPLGTVGHPTIDAPGAPTTPDGYKDMLWSGQTYTVNTMQPWTDFANSLMADPSDNPLQLPDPGDIVNAFAGLLAALINSFFPLVPNSFLIDSTYWEPINGPLTGSPDVDPYAVGSAAEALSADDLPL